MQRPRMRMLRSVMRKLQKNANGYEELPPSPSFKRHEQGRPRRRSNGRSSCSSDVITVIAGRKDETEIFMVEQNILECSLVQALLQRGRGRASKSNNDTHIFLERCDAIFFDHVLWLLRNDDPSIRYLNLDVLLDFYDAEFETDSSSC